MTVHFPPCLCRRTPALLPVGYESGSESSRGHTHTRTQADSSTHSWKSAASAVLLPLLLGLRFPIGSPPLCPSLCSTCGFPGGRGTSNTCARLCISCCEECLFRRRGGTIHTCLRAEPFVVPCVVASALTWGLPNAALTAGAGSLHLASSFFGAPLSNADGARTRDAVVRRCLVAAAHTCGAPGPANGARAGARLAVLG